MDDLSVYKILPREMWCTILGLLSTKDKQSAMNCSMFLRKLLKDNRTSFLFSKVLTTLVALKLETLEAGCETIHVIPCITQLDTSKARLVCSSWNAAVKICNDLPVMTGIRPFSDVRAKTYLEICNQDIWANPYIFSTLHPEKAQEFVATFIHGHVSRLSYNPFLGRFVIINIGIRNIDNFDTFLNAVLTILEAFGHHVWYVTLQLSKLVDWRNWIAFMPNLVSLRLKFETSWLEPPLYLRSGLPELAKLKNLEVFGLRSYLLGELFTKYNHIPYVNIDNCELVVEWSPNPFINLKRLSLQIADESEYDILEWVGRNMKLETLSVYNHVRYYEYSKKRIEFVENDGLMLSLFLKIKEYWCNSLNTLRLVFEGAQVKRKYSLECLQLQLPNLCRLELISDGNIFLDFIQPLKQLEVLEIMFVTNDMYLLDQNLTPPLRNFERKWVPNQIIQFIGYESRMQDSNIWTLLPHLRKLRVTILRQNPILSYEYTREKSGLVVRKCVMQQIALSAERNIFPYFKH